ncbi:MAG: GTP pyrophosphokinase [Acidobacteriota bacterium]|jgi:hypothetical protein|nr:GTP pyrophosphokinase [Acidobacteriota bacterium]
MDIRKTERLISEINRIHRLYSEDYFETGKVEKLNLSRTISHIPKEHILRYRLNLHESINDYLVKSDLDDVNYYYRVKTAESILDKIRRYSESAEQYPVNNWMNDIFGCRTILCKEEIGKALDGVDLWREKYGLKNWYLRNKDGYKGVHIYFKNNSNFYFPWELQLWDAADIESNIESHRRQKRNFV